jgi:nucleotide-binding universal stress UspA family protein
MKSFAKAMVGLDLTAMDEIVISKVGALAGVLGLDKVYFIHVSHDLSLPEELRKKYPNLLAPADEAIEAELDQLIKSCNFPDHVAYEVFAEEGDPMKTVLRWAKLKDVDLLIMGRKTQLEGSGSLAKQMAQKAPCSVLFLTENTEFHIPKKILLALDFSDHSNLTLTFVERLSAEMGAEVIGLHVYDIPSGHYKTGKSYEETAEIMEGHARKDYQNFIKKHNHPDFDCLFEAKGESNEGKLIILKAQQINADMILMGSRGRTASAAVLLGSIAEKLVQINNQVPMLIFKKKGETMSFIDALFKI